MITGFSSYWGVAGWADIDILGLLECTKFWVFLLFERRVELAVSFVDTKLRPVVLGSTRFTVNCWSRFDDS